MTDSKFHELVAQTLRTQDNAGAKWFIENDKEDPDSVVIHAELVMIIIGIQHLSIKIEASTFNSEDTIQSAILAMNERLIWLMQNPNQK